jgi:hypothetical protein
VERQANLEPQEHLVLVEQVEPQVLLEPLDLKDKDSIG